MVPIYGVYGPYVMVVVVGGGGGGPELLLYLMMIPTHNQFKNLEIAEIN